MRTTMGIPVLLDELEKGTPVETPKGKRDQRRH